jgi:lysophospholipase L1-like esterase
MRYLILICALLTACGGGSVPDPPKTIAAIGDSLTLQTGLCADATGLPSCAHPERSYATYIGVIGNFGRGGDTCTPEEPFDSGPFKGQQRGMTWRIHELIALHPTQGVVFAGYNDLTRGVSNDLIVKCLADLWWRLQANGIEPIAVTYPKVQVNTEKVAALNVAIREAAKSAGIRLVDAETVDVPTVDGLHPTETGARAIASLFSK